MAALPEAYGGQGLSYVALCDIAEELGRALAPSAFGSSIFLSAEAIAERAWLDGCQGGRRLRRHFTV